MKKRFVDAMAACSGMRRLWAYIAICLCAWFGKYFVAQLPEWLAAEDSSTKIICTIGSVGVLFVARWLMSWILDAEKAPRLATFVRISALLSVVFVLIEQHSDVLNFLVRALVSIPVLGVMIFVLIAICAIYLVVTPYVELIGLFAWQKKNAPKTIGFVCSKIMWTCAMIAVSLLVWLAVGLVVAPFAMLAISTTFSAQLVEQIIEARVASAVFLFLAFPLQLIIAAWVRPTWKASVAVGLANIVLMLVWSQFPEVNYLVPLGAYAAFLVACLMPGPKCSCDKNALTIVPPQPVVPVVPSVSVKPQPVVSPAPRKRGRPKKAQAEATVQPVKSKRGRPAKSKAAASKTTAKKGSKKAGKKRKA